MFLQVMTTSSHKSNCNKNVSKTIVIIGENNDSTHALYTLVYFFICLFLSFCFLQDFCQSLLIPVASFVVLFVN